MYNNSAAGMVTSTEPENEPLLKKVIDELDRVGSRNFNYLNDMEFKLFSIIGENHPKPQQVQPVQPELKTFNDCVINKIGFLNQQANRLEDLLSHLNKIV